MLVKRLVNTFDAQGNLLCCDTYDAEGVYAYSESKEYNSINLIIAESNRLGQQIIHTFDDRGRKISSRIPHADKEISNTYDFRNQLVESVERVGNLVFVAKNSYDLLGRAITVSDHFGNTTTYEYDAFGNQVKIVFSAVYDEKQNIVNPTFSYEYDIFGNVTKIIDPKGNSVSKTYTVRGQPLKVKYSDGSSERFGYDLGGALTHTRSKDGIEKNFQFDNQKRITVDQTVHVSAEHSTFIRHKHNAFHCTRDGLLALADDMGTFTHQLAEAILSDPTVDKLRPIRFLLKLAEKYSKERLEKACQRAFNCKMYSYSSVKSILENNLESEPLDAPTTSKVIQLPSHRFARNPEDYKSGYKSSGSFNEKLETMHPVSKHGNAMIGGFHGLIADQIIEEDK